MKNVEKESTSWPDLSEMWNQLPNLRICAGLDKTEKKTDELLLALLRIFVLFLKAQM